MQGLISLTSNEKIAQRVKKHREDTYQMFVSRYLEFLPLIINYEGLTETAVDPLILENFLHQGVGVAIGPNVEGKTVILGYVTRANTLPVNGVSQLMMSPLTKNDIVMIIPQSQQLEYYKQITYHDGYESGNFVVLYNKPYNLQNDYNIVQLYGERIAELSLTRYSIYMQAKISHVVKGDADDEDIEQIVDDLWNGKPFIKTSTYFDEDNIVAVNNVSEIISALPELKREYQNNIAELNCILGLNSLGVDKESGVSDVEAQSNTAFKKANESIYLRARNEPLKHYNKKFGTAIQAEFNDLMISQLSSLEKVQMGENNDTFNN